MKNAAGRGPALKGLQPLHAVAEKGPEQARSDDKIFDLIFGAVGIITEQGPEPARSNNNTHNRV